MFLFAVSFLIVVLLLLQCAVNKGGSSVQGTNDALHKLQYKFFAVYFPATFADWLQGPYLYKLYNSYGFKGDEIFLLYVAGFASSLIFGTCISGLADYCGRRRMCIIFNLVYLISCLTKLSKRFDILVAGRILGGIGTSILFSVFEAWYVYQHVEKHQFPVSWVNNTLSQATFYNGLLAIVAGLISNTFAEVFEMGPVIPFLLAVPCLMLSGSLAVFMWDEAFTLRSMQCSDLNKMVKIMLKREVVLLCLIQSVFESVMYIFIILWTPILSPISPPLGIVFSCFMICIMIGSLLNKWLITRKHEPNFILTATMLMASFSLGTCAVAETTHPHSCQYACFVSFLFFEVAVGLYYPVIGFVRSCIIPESFRATITSWFRLPMNLITCFSLFYFRHSQFTEKSNSYKMSSASSSYTLSSNAQIFAICALALLGTGGLCRNLYIYPNHQNKVQDVHNF